MVVPARVPVLFSAPRAGELSGEGLVLHSLPSCPGMLQSLSMEQETSRTQHRVARRRESPCVHVRFHEFSCIAKSNVDVALKSEIS